MTTTWHCLNCTATETGDDAEHLDKAAAKHTKATSHATSIQTVNVRYTKPGERDG